MTDADTLTAFLDAANPEPSPLIREMTEYGERESFPTVGPHVGRFLRVLARVVDAERVFEFGSGFGYSAAWFLGALPADGELVLTDYDEDNLADARDFLARAGHDTTIRYEAGDAMETFDRYSGPFDVVLVDLDKSLYVDAFEAARTELADGGVIVADNVLGAGPADPEHVTAELRGENTDVDLADDIAAYVAHVRDDDEFETAFLPLGEGVAISTKR